MSEESDQQEPYEDHTNHPNVARTSVVIEDDSLAGGFGNTQRLDKLGENQDANLFGSSHSDSRN